MSEREIRPNYYKVVVRAQPLGDSEKRDVEVECFDLIDALGLGFYLGNALKYLFRAGRKTKSRIEDLRKVITYAEQTIERDDRSEKVGLAALEREILDQQRPKIAEGGAGFSSIVEPDR